MTNREALDALRDQMISDGILDDPVKLLDWLDEMAHIEIEGASDTYVDLLRKARAL